MDDRERDEHYAEMHSSNLGGFVAGLLIGALAGAATMLLMAPQSGEETRHMIGEKTTQLKEKVAETADEARQRAASKIEEVSERAREVKDDVRGRVEKMQQRGQEMLEEQRTRVTDAVEAGKQSMRRG